MEHLREATPGREVEATASEVAATATTPRMKPRMTPRKTAAGACSRVRSVAEATAAEVSESQSEVSPSGWKPLEDWRRASGGANHLSPDPKATKEEEVGGDELLDDEGGRRRAWRAEKNKKKEDGEEEEEEAEDKNKEDGDEEEEEAEEFKRKEDADFSKDRNKEDGDEEKEDGDDLFDDEKEAEDKRAHRKRKKQDCSNAPWRQEGGFTRTKMRRLQREREKRGASSGRAQGSDDRKRRGKRPRW
jgi:hypothetical protein